jgi:hypothetical protein
VACGTSSVPARQSFGAVDVESGPSDAYRQGDSTGERNRGVLNSHTDAGVTDVRTVAGGSLARSCVADILTGAAMRWKSACCTRPFALAETCPATDSPTGTTWLSNCCPSRMDWGKTCSQNRQRALKGLAPEARLAGVADGLNDGYSSSSEVAQYVVKACWRDKRAGAANVLAAGQESS